MTDFSFIFSWWLVLFFLGIACLPLTFSLFPKFWDKGYVFSKILAILLSSYFIWLLGSLKILPFSRLTAWGIVVALGLFNWFFLTEVKSSKVKVQSYSSKFKVLIRENWKTFLFEELLFLACLSFWSYIRGFQPNINGLEKLMDYGFVNSILRSRYFPPADLWLAGKTINYYYFGHLVAAFLTKLSGLDSSATYNLMLATIFAFCFTAPFSLVSNLVIQRLSSEPKNRLTASGRLLFSAFLAGAIASAIISFASSFHTPYHIYKNGSQKYWYPDATRFIGYNPDTEDKTIHEFPAYSHVVADLHGHLSDLPFVLLFLALLFSLLLKKSPKKSLLEIGNWKLEILLGLCLGVMYMTSSWEFPIYLLVLGLTLLWKNLYQSGWQFNSFKKTILASSFYLLASILFSLPFHLNFTQIAQGIAFVNAHSPFYQLFILWGFFWIISLSFIIFLFKNRLLQSIKPENLIARIAKFLNAQVKILKPKPAFEPLALIDGFVLIFIVVATLLIIIPEIIYVKDIYIASYHRANTVFKLTYQAYVLYSLSTGYIIIRLLSVNKGILLRITYCVLLFSILIYPYFSIRSYYGLKNYQGLNGWRWLAEKYPADYQAILWLEKNLDGQPVILEAVGESYTDYARVSANTGLPTVLGWPVHEWLWRGSYDEAGKRREEVRQIYEAESLDPVKKLLDQYQVEYIFVGNLEREQYPKLNEEKFKTVAEPVFSSQQTTIYKLKTNN